MKKLPSAGSFPCPSRSLKTANPPEILIHYLSVIMHDAVAECQIKESQEDKEMTKTVTEVLKLVGKAAARMVIWLAGKLEGGK